MNHKKKIIFSVILIIMLCMVSGIVKAAPLAISSSKTEVSVGDSFTVTISSDYIGRVNVSSNGGITLSDNKVWVEKGSETITATAKTAGTYTITATPVELSTGQNDVSVGAQSITIKVNDKSANTNPTNNNNTNNKPEPTFTTTNQTVYATGDVNVRSSYSTSSSALGSLKKGDSVIRIGIGSNGWSKVTYNGQTAYISSSLLTTTKPVEEEKSTNKALKSLIVEPTGLDPAFDKETTNYAITIGSDVDSLKIDAVAEDEKAKVTVSGNENLQVGTNTVKVLVTAEDGTVRTYTIIVTKQEKEQLKLTNLEISGISLNKTFDPDTYEYTVNLDEKSNLNKLNIKATANDENAIIEVVGNENLIVGENVITIMVTSEDGKENVTYQIIVNKPDTTNLTTKNDTNVNNKTFLFVAIGIFAIAVLLIIFIIVKSRKKSKEQEEADFGFDYNENSNITEELYGIKKTDDIKEDIKLNTEEEQYSDTISHTKLYDVEKEVDFSNDDDKKTKRKGKHSK